MQDPELHHPTVTAPKTAPSPHSCSQTFFVCSYRSSNIHSWLLQHLSHEAIVSVLRNLLDCVCLALWPFQQISVWLKYPVRTRACDYEATFTGLQKASSASSI